jgi:hypothetical protein
MPLTGARALDFLEAVGLGLIAETVTMLAKAARRERARPGREVLRGVPRPPARRHRPGKYAVTAEGASPCHGAPATLGVEDGAAVSTSDDLAPGGMSAIRSRGC